MDHDPLLETALRQTVAMEDGERWTVIAPIHPAGVERRLERFPITIGRLPSLDLVLDHPSVSRQHALLEERSGGLWLMNLDSTNGCSVNGVFLRGTPAAVSAGDILRLGDVILRLVHRPLEPPESGDTEDSILIGGPSLHPIRRLLRLLGPTALHTLITGASGTGKELAAREIHRFSRRTGPFVAINCAALPEALVESEFFGYERGAFTGAVRDKPGLFEAARDGTLFLDEVSELPPTTQAKLLRVVETGETRRIGAVSTMEVDCRIVAATNHDMAEDVRQGRFRADLYARLAEAEIAMPSLADRIEDLNLLLEHLDRRAHVDLAFDADAMEALACYSWPLNVRELDNLVRTLGVLAQGQLVSPTLLPPHILLGRAQRQAPADPTADRVIGALRKNRFNVRRTSQELKVSRTFIYRCVDRSGLDMHTLRTGTRHALTKGSDEDLSH